MIGQELIEDVQHLPLAPEIEPQWPQFQLCHRYAGGPGFEREPDTRLAAGRKRRARRFERLPAKGRLQDLQRYELHVIRSAKLATLAIDRLSLDHRTAGNGIRRDLLGLGPLQPKANNRSRGDRSKVMGIQYAQHGLRQLWEVVVQFATRAGVDVGECLDEARDVRVPTVLLGR